jgi:hypothetical protein
LIVAQCNHRLPSQAISDNHQLTGRPLLILIDAAFSSKLSRHTSQQRRSRGSQQDLCGR